ncbi:MAG: hypothetical protein C6I01_02615 [Epsilonproteobacteria bacterium]|nr:hypothetical protein [Campylobacterota bacterium]
MLCLFNFISSTPLPVKISTSPTPSNPLFQKNTQFSSISPSILPKKFRSVSYQLANIFPIGGIGKWETNQLLSQKVW